MTHLNFFRSKNWTDSEATKSLDEVHKSVSVPKTYSFWKKLFAFSGPGYLVAVGYMDPGNWATALAGGSKYGYALLYVVLCSSLMAMVLQYLSLKLGIVTGKDLAQACRAYYPKPVSYVLWFLAEIAIIATDLAEVLGSAIALNLLFNWPILFGVIFTVIDVFILLLLQKKGFRWLESLVILLTLIIMISFGIQILMSQPQLSQVLAGFIPSTSLFKNSDMLYLALGILGATVMPHNLYLHSAVAQTRNYAENLEGKKEAIKFSAMDSTFALCMAFFVNAAILVVAASVFYKQGLFVSDLHQAYHLFTPILGTSIAATVFAIALLASGQNSTITGTLSGQIVMEGFLNFKMKPWLRRLLTRLLAVVPAVLVIILLGDAYIGNLLVFSQVILSMQLSFAVFPLVFFTSNSKIMGCFSNCGFLKGFSFGITIMIAGLNAWLLYQFFS